MTADDIRTEIMTMDFNNQRELMTALEHIAEKLCDLDHRINAQATSNSVRAAAERRNIMRGLGRKGGLKRAQNLTATRRKEIAQKAAKARWAHKEKKG